MKNDTTTALQLPEASTKDVLTDILRDGAREMLGKAIEAEVADYVAVHAHQRAINGHRLVVRNGHASERELQTGLGAIPVKQGDMIKSGGWSHDQAASSLIPSTN